MLWECESGGPPSPQKPHHDFRVPDDAPLDAPPAGQGNSVSYPAGLAHADPKMT